MATLTVRNLDESLVRKLRIRAAEHGRSAEAEHRSALETGKPTLSRAEAIDRLQQLLKESEGRGLPTAAEALRESRHERKRKLTGSHEGMP